MECNNNDFKDQLDISKAVIYRKNLLRENIHQEPLTFSITNVMAVAESF